MLCCCLRWFCTNRLCGAAPSNRYQLNPSFYKDNVTYTILLKSLTVISESDFYLCICLLNEIIVSSGDWCLCHLLICTPILILFMISSRTPLSSRSWTRTISSTARTMKHSGSCTSKVARSAPSPRTFLALSNLCVSVSML